MKRSIALSSVVLLAISTILQAGESGPTRVGPRTTSLAISPARLATGADCSLLVKPADQTEGDAAGLYGQAVKNIPTNINSSQLTDWTRQPLNELPLDQVKAFLQRAQPCLELIGKAVRCKECNWPPFVAGQQPENLSEYRVLTNIVCLKARLEIARHQYEDAVATLQTGLTMSRQVGEAPTLVQSMVGIAMASLTLRGLDDMAQMPGSPNLYEAIEALPRPFIDVEKPIASELHVLETSTQYPRAVRDMMREQVEPSYERIRQLSQRLSSEIGARQCVEAIRNYAATHDGNLPAQLKDIADVELPNDPITDKPYKYGLNNGRAFVETGVTEGNSIREALRLEITVAR